MNCLRTLFLNARSLKAVVESPDDAGKRISKLNIFQNLVYLEQYDIICVCETWLNDLILDNEILPGYTIHRKDRHDNLRGGGVLVAVKNNLRSSRRASLEGAQSELLMIELYPANCTKFMLGVIYRPPNSDEDVLMELRSSLERLDESCQLVLVGDFNLPNIDWSLDFPSPNSEGGFKEELFCEIIADQFLYQMADGPTHLRGNKLDCVFCNNPELITNVNCINPTNLFPSDHYLIEFDIKLYFQRAKAVRRTIYDFKNANFNAVRQHLLSVPLYSAISDHADIDECWKVWKELFLTTIDQFVPKKTVLDINTPPWIDREVKHLINKKYTALRQYRQKRTEARKRKLRQLTQQTKDLIKAKRQQYLERVQDSLSNSPKSFWSYHKHILRSKNSPSSNTYNNVTATTPNKKAELFNEYFASVFLPKSSTNNTKLDCMNPKTFEEISSIKISECEVEHYLNNLDTSKAYGPDGIPPRLLKECSKEISSSLCSLFNKSIETGRVPREWKKANVIPIHKKDCVEPVTNYRPISLLPVVSKVLERCVFNNIYPFIRVLINNVQHGFLRNRSCVTQLLGVLHDIGKSLDNNRQVDVLYLDFSKAFDSVDHAILLQKLQLHGINGSLLRWFDSYLNDRQQRVVIEGAASSWSPVSSGVPQGSILGPLLFVIFINDLPDNLSSSTNSALYADDSKLYSEIRSVDNCQSLQEDLTMLENWCTNSRMNFNAGKCKVLTVTRKRKPINFPYRVHGNELSSCKAEKDLGLLVSSDLKWGPHILKTVAKANKMLGLLKRSCFEITNTQVRRTLYLTLVRSQLTYGCEVWCPSSRQLSLKIEGVQRRATLWILMKNRGELSYVERLRKLNLIPLVYDREQKDLIFYYKCKNNMIDLDVEQYVETTSTRTRAGTSQLLRSQACKTTTFQSSYFVRIVNLWNYVCKTAPSNCFNTLSSFKTYLHKTYLQLTATAYDPDLPSSHSLITTE